VAFESIHNEKEVLLRVAGGDRLEFQRLYNHCYPLVQQYIRLFVTSRERMGELTQDVFVRIWEKKDKLAAVDSFSGYLFITTKNVVFNYFRALKMQQRFSDLEISGEVAARENSENELLFKQYYLLAQEGIDQLPAGRRKIVKMSIEQGMSLDEIAEALQISKAGVKKQLYTGLAAVKQYLQEHGDMGLLLFVFLSLFDK